MDVASCIGDRIDKTWNSIGKLEDGQLRELSLVMRGIMTVPHGSAHCEQVFSRVIKNRTLQRSSLAESTMESLLVLKSTLCCPVESVQKLSDVSLSELKSSYTQSLC